MIMSLGGERKQFVEIWTLSQRFFLDEPTTLHLHDIVRFVVHCEGCFDKHIHYISLLFTQSCHLVNQTIISNQSLCSCTLLFWILMLPFSHSHNSEIVSSYTKPLHFPAPQWCWSICNCTCDEYQLFCRWVLHSHVHNSVAYGARRRHNILLRVSPCIEDAITMLMLTQHCGSIFQKQLPSACVCYTCVLHTCNEDICTCLRVPSTPWWNQIPSGVPCSR